MKNNYLTVLVSVLLVIHIQARNPCKSPKQWRANIYDRDYKLKLKSKFEISYDSVNKRSRRTGIQQIGSYSDYVDILEFYNEKVSYKYSFTRKTCEKNSLKQEWKDFDIPDDATYYGDLVIGASELKDSNLLVSSWVYKFESEGQTYDLLSLVTVNNCVPVSLYVDNDSRDYQLQIFNVTAGINESDFSLPDECLSL